MHSPIVPIQGSTEPTLPLHGLAGPSTSASAGDPAGRPSTSASAGDPAGKPSTSAGAGDPAGKLSPFAAHLHSGEQALGIEDPPGAPPAEVLDQMEAAGRICRQLLESGQRLRFSIEREGGVKIELADREGKMRAVSPAEALDIAAGKSLE